jgi:hypothetical protein
MADTPIEISGFSLGEIDQVLIGDEVEVESRPLEPELGSVAVARLGEVFQLGLHRLIVEPNNTEQRAGHKKIRERRAKTLNSFTQIDQILANGCLGAIKRLWVLIIVQGAIADCHLYRPERLLGQTCRQLSVAGSGLQRFLIARIIVCTLFRDGFGALRTHKLKREIRLRFMENAFILKTELQLCCGKRLSPRILSLP